MTPRPLTCAPANGRSRIRRAIAMARCSGGGGSAGGAGGFISFLSEVDLQRLVISFALGALWAICTLGILIFYIIIVQHRGPAAYSALRIPPRRLFVHGRGDCGCPALSRCLCGPAVSDKA